jgi:hypothetical protein
MRTGKRYGKLGRLTYGKTKYGGMRHSLIQETLDVWSCQCCGKEQAKGMPIYLHELLEKEFFKICSVCYRSLCSNKTWEETKLAYQGHNTIS